ncbi:TerC family protein [Herminiimonas fonticola]|uniref:YjbE family integral membrane protein n=1 Tax=Herminiimonas fonticola TaxID=303380 RepID=A0A4V3BWC1_9BURK|nr:TerC family protein [Herminiimonas fonticola]RBA25003.1 integral membrane protein, YjbE family [Herminiimonas fonticola]TDN94118.1 YjbE family integral membrane protein [Herminiimonas fonticola]
MEFIGTAAFWAALGNIILINIVLSGDNAVVIALAAKSLPPKQKKMAVIWGSAAAIILRIVLTIFALQLLTLPYLKLIGAVLLFYIGVQLLAEGDGEEDIEGHSNLWGAIKTILVADLVMSLDNVLGVAAAANGNVTLLVIGLAISVPLIVFGSAIVLKLMEKFPIIITLGAALLGYLAGEMLFSDPIVTPWIATNIPHHELALFGHSHLSIPGLILAIGVVIVGTYLSKRNNHAAAA